VTTEAGAPAGSPPAANGKARRGWQVILTRRFISVLVLALLGFGLEAVLRPVVPLIILDRGGDAVVVGLVTAIYALPSLLFRPVIGKLVDTRDHGLLLRLGALPGAIVPLGILLPGLIPLAIIRLVHGTGWAIYTVATQTLVAKLSPPEQRGEAAGYFHAMPALATLIFPGIGVALYAATGEVGPVVAAVVLGVAALIAAARLQVPRAERPPSAVTHPVDDAGKRRSGAAARLRAAGLTDLVERSALPATVMVTTFMSASALFIIFAPVYAVAVGAPLASLAIFYPIYGIVATASQAVAGRLSDRIGRGRAIRLGAALAAGGLAIATLGAGMTTLVLGGVLYAIAISIVIPTLTAMTADRAPAGRLGAAIATYTIGFQIATGVSSILWGFLITAFGFPWPFVVAIVFQAVTFAATFMIRPKAA
jgi:MFS family permease